ncbi:GNAT family N-acetyltransferase [Martelella radicis]|uniref:Ribosomal protein S18 acetylase RimI-like enzyme n=1 Tax=Martelella radicis TaxID=1397476 RepID=A0A7W6PAL3_9HYPH|nr:GNAT family N-acetyltransferase [Martelella radicis]MBB4121734.1 ribosomal protein S18 acetylase RimI-like enzyme [Martelella radicis]
MNPKITLRAATPDDAPAMAALINIAGEGLPEWFWSTLAENNEDPFTIGEARARRETGGFSWKNGHVIEADGAARALLITYPIGDEPDPIDPAEMPAVFIPLQELENEALGTLYVNVLATEEAYRKRGYGSELLEKAKELAKGRRMSLIVSDANENAMRLYEAHGFTPKTARPSARTESWSGDGDNWVLMLREG